MNSLNTFFHNTFWPHGLVFIKFPRIENQNVISQVTWEWGIQHGAYKNIQLCFWSCRRLESPTRTLTLEAPKGVEVNAGVGEFRATCRKELTLESSEGEVSNLLVLVDRSYWILILLLRRQRFLRHMDRIRELALSRMWIPAVLCCLMAINNARINDISPWTECPVTVVQQVSLLPHSSRGLLIWSWARVTGCTVLQTLSFSLRVSSRLSSFLPSPKAMPVGGLVTLPLM